MIIPLGHSRRRAVAGVIAALFLFLMIFTAGLGYFLYQNQASYLKYQANANGVSARGLAGLERLSLFPTLKGPNIVVQVNNTGGAIATVQAAYVKDVVTGRIVSPIMVLGPGGGTNRSTPLNLLVGEHGGFVLSSYTYGGLPVYVNILSSRGDIYSTRYPLSISGNSTTVLSTTTISSTSVVGAVGNPLVVVMTATPPQVFGGKVVNLTVIFYNFATTAITNPALNPPAPSFFLTGTATLTPLGCSGPTPSGTIPGYSGVGTPPHIWFSCLYTAHTGPLGGIATFEGGGSGVYNGSTIYSAEASSNIIQIGGLTNALVYGAFSINFFEFRISACTNGPTLNGSGSIFNEYPTLYSSPCSTRGPVPPPNWTGLPGASNASASGNFYVAFYLQITNNFNTTLPLMQYTMMQLDQSDGGESDWWLAGSANQLTSGVYYPNYSPGGNNLPTLTAYPSDCNVVNGNNVPTDTNCFALGPGQSQVLTLAACSYHSTNWDWGGVPNADHFDVKSGCVSSWPLFSFVYGHGSASVATLVISFEYKGHIFTQNIAFEGVAVLP